MSLPATAAAQLARLELFGIRLGLATSRDLAAALGDPQHEFPSLLVAGTNGKGSTAALLAAIGQAAGYRTGLYTSPHLEDVEERIRIDGTTIAGDLLGELLERVITTCEARLGHPPTYFEALTAAAFLHFAAEKVELAVLEVGLGGRLDATNIVEPELSVITAIGRDHCDRLGDSLSAIAREKAGILRRGRPALSGAMAAEAERAIAEVAAEVGAELHRAAEEIAVGDLRPASLGPRRVEITTPEDRYALTLPLLGGHQAANLGLAVRGAELLRARGWESFDATSIAAGVAAGRWPGRLELVEVPIAGLPLARLLLDGAHNPAGAASLAAFLTATGEPYDLLFGAFADKEVAAMLPPLALGAERVVLTRVPGDRGLDPASLAALLPGRRALTVEPELAAALEAALRPERLTVVTGSLLLVGAVRQRLSAGLGVLPLAVEPLFVPAAR